MPEKPINIAISVSYKQDPCNLIEFIEYHRLIGVQRIYICNNDDNTIHSDYIMAPYVEEGFVQNIHTARWFHNRSINRQALAHDYVLKIARKEVKWLAMLDMDEFIYPVVSNDINYVLKHYDNYAAIVINYACFGSAGLKYRPNLQTEAYVYRAADNWGYNKLTKSVGQVDKVSRCSHHHYFDVKAGHMVDENKIKCGWVKQYKDNVIRLNHYLARSKEDYEDKIKRGNPLGEKRTWNWFQWADQNELYDNSMSRFVPMLREAIMTKKRLFAYSRKKICVL